MASPEGLGSTGPLHVLMKVLWISRQAARFFLIALN
jgi:hypothetical protein